MSGAGAPRNRRGHHRRPHPHPPSHGSPGAGDAGGGGGASPPVAVVAVPLGVAAAVGGKDEDPDEETRKKAAAAGARSARWWLRAALRVPVRPQRRLRRESNGSLLCGLLFLFGSLLVCYRAAVVVGTRAPHRSLIDRAAYQCSGVYDNNDNDDNDDNQYYSYKRRALFVQIATMASYYSLPFAAGGHSRYKGGEYYMAACLDYALRENGWTVDRRTAASLVGDGDHHYENSSGSSSSGGGKLLALMDQYDLVVGNGEDVWRRLGVLVDSTFTTTTATKDGNNTTTTTTTTTSPWPAHQLCKLRSLSWWGNAVHHNDNDDSDNQRYPLHHRQYWKPYPAATFYNTFVGFFPHSLLLLEKDAHRPPHKPPPQQQQRQPPPRVGVLLGKRAAALRPLRGAAQALLDRGFELHATCQDCRDDSDGDNGDSVLPAAVIRHGGASPSEYARLLRRSQFLLGAGRPYDSPSPLEALANGAAFLNPLRTTTNNATGISLEGGVPLRAAQHTPLALLGPPYVYNVRLDDASSVVEAAARAAAHRFASYVPADYQPLAMVGRVCSLLQELPAVCGAAAAGGTASSSSTVRKSVAGYDANQMAGVHFYGKQQQEQSHESPP